jgi:hypothetical protein
VIDIGVITNWSGLAKAITYTIRVICRVNFKTVKMYESSVVQSLIESYRQGLAEDLFPQTPALKIF